MNQMTKMNYVLTLIAILLAAILCNTLGNRAIEGLDAMNNTDR